MEYGSDYIIPKPLDPRVLVDVSLAVAKAAVKSKVAKNPRKTGRSTKKTCKIWLSGSETG